MQARNDEQTPLCVSRSRGALRAQTLTSERETTSRRRFAFRARAPQSVHGRDQASAKGQADAAMRCAHAWYESVHGRWSRPHGGEACRMARMAAMRETANVLQAESNRETARAHSGGLLRFPVRHQVV